ncbi:hypothetical protein RchiOBHm_Chr7g0222861 [Rosa chinensis]|uniref:Uncharacterized protein n=1 Tax=Rosa chinensis TaxID=74649 RepID=A0A2P6PDF2_ROSCH|nr:hypothetical protein RchiOBHm_Chr7g0222861 [Rosa chinensis]
MQNSSFACLLEIWKVVLKITERKVVGEFFFLVTSFLKLSQACSLLLLLECL